MKRSVSKRVAPWLLFVAASVLAAAPPPTAPAPPEPTTQPVSLDPAGGPPPGAIVLFGGSSTEAWVAVRDDGPIGWSVMSGELEVNRAAGDIVTRRTFGDCRLHLEWRSPPGGAGQTAGNSGVKIQRRYEVQILNTPPTDDDLAADEAGAIYGLKAADHNASLGPGAWQSYDIWFTAARWDGSRKTANARMTVFWNGMLVHDDVVLPRQTGNVAPPEAPGPDSILLQAHHSTADGEVRFRNVWVVEGTEGLRD